MKVTMPEAKKGIIINTNTLYNNLKRTLPKKSEELSVANKFRLRVKDITDNMLEYHDETLNSVDLRQDVFEIISEYINLKNNLN